MRACACACACACVDIEVCVYVSDLRRTAGPLWATSESRPPSQSNKSRAHGTSSSSAPPRTGASLSDTCLPSMFGSALFGESAIGATHCNSSSTSSTIAVVGAISNGSNAPTCSSQRRAIGGGASAASECPSGPRHAKRVGPPSLPTAWPLRPQGRECAGDCQCPPPAASIRHKPTGRRVPQHTGTQGGIQL